VGCLLHGFAADSTADGGATAIVEMLFCTSLVALVGAAENQPVNSPRKLQIVNTKVSCHPLEFVKGQKS
jgi:hypothetical protein